VAAPSTPARRRFRWDPLPYLLVLPTVVLIVVFTLVPAVYGLIVSVHRVQFVRLGSFIGLANYVEVLAEPRTIVNLRNSFALAFGSVVLTFLLGFLLALALNERVIARPLIRTLVMVPWVTSYVVANLLAKWMVDFDLGAINQNLRALGLPAVQFLGDPINAMVTLMVVNTWLAAPYAMLLLLAGLQGIPSEMYEAAAVDGASKPRRFLTMTLPMMRHAILILLLLLTLRDFSILVSILVLTGGGPGYLTETLTVRMYWEAFTNFRMGTASATATIIFAINMVFSLLYLRLMRAERA
jgi:multiple sugar transport system permease protein